MLKVSFHTFGCKNNLADTNKVVLELSDFNGLEILEAELKADVHVVNTCTVTASADAQARNLLRRINRHNKDALVIVTGCSLRSNSENYKKLKTELKLSGNLLELCDNTDNEILKIIKRRCKLEKRRGELQKKDNELKLFRTRVFLQVHDGCDHFCSYCIVPFVRGEPRSRDLGEVVKEAKELERSDIKEIVITGINIGDHENGIENLVEELLKATTKIRIRLSSLRPSRISPRLVELMKEKRLCPHLHISLQSASDKVLGLMNRRDYKAKDFLSICELVDRKLSTRSPFMAADIIVGHPGEAELDFLESFKILEQSNLNKVHVFPFSPRPGTAAFIMKKPEPAETQRRRDMLLNLSEKRYLESLRGMKGKTVEVLWETESFGHSENYYPITGKGIPNTLGILKVTGVDISSQQLLV